MNKRVKRHIEGGDGWNHSFWTCCGISWSTVRTNYDAQHWSLRFPTALIFYFFHYSNSAPITTWSQFSPFPCQDPRNGLGLKTKQNQIWNINRSKMLDNLNQSNLSFCHLKLWHMTVILTLSLKKKLEICNWYLQWL